MFSVLAGSTVSCVYGSRDLKYRLAVRGRNDGEFLGRATWRSDIIVVR